MSRYREKRKELRELPGLCQTAWTIGLDILAWFIIHLAVVRVMPTVPRRRFDPDGPWNPRR